MVLAAFGDCMNPLPPSHAALELALWPGGSAPARPERTFTFPLETATSLRNVTHPTLRVFLPDPGVATGTGVVICPGGGHHMLSIDHEGYEVARWLAERGVAAGVLKYRLIETSDNDEVFLGMLGQVLATPEMLERLATEHTPVVTADGQRALALMREKAPTWNLRPDRIGILGFSAGGHLAYRVARHHDQASRPDFVASIYGAYWEDVQVADDPAPLFLAFANDDPLGALVIGTSLAFYQAWTAARQPVELHAYTQGGHGFGMRPQHLPSDGWINRFYEWLQAQRLLDGGPPA